MSSVGDILENKYVEVKEASPNKARHASGREKLWANLRQTSNNLGFSTVDDGSSSVPLVSTQARRVIPHDTPHHSSQTRDLLMHKFTDTPLPSRPATSLGRSSVSSSMQVLAHATRTLFTHALVTRTQVNASFPSTRSNLGLGELSEADEHTMKGSRISKDNTPKDQMANILKEELQAQAAETPAVKIAGSVGRYSNVEYWQQKSETFKQQVRGARRRCPPLLLTRSRSTTTWSSPQIDRLEGCSCPRPATQLHGSNCKSHKSCAAAAPRLCVAAYLSLAHMSGLRPSTDKTNEGGRCSDKCV